MTKQPGTDAEIDARLLAGGKDIQRFLELGRLSASLLHEISNPLTTALIELEQVEQKRSVDTKTIRDSLIRLSRYVQVARQQLRGQSEHQYFSLNQQIRAVKHLVEPLARTNSVQLATPSNRSVRLWGDPVKLQQILVNLTVNAIEAYEPQFSSNQCRLVYLKLDKRANFVTISVIDRAGVISKTSLTKIYQPFYSTKTHKGRGLGLGLFIVKAYVENDFHGSISVKSSKKAGTRFVIRLPIVHKSEIHKTKLSA